MPVIPTYMPGRVENRPLPSGAMSAGASAASFGAGQAQDMQEIGQGLMRVGGTMGAIAKANKEEYDREIVRARINQAREEMHQFMTTDILKRKGESAFGADEAVKLKAMQISERMNQGMSNDDQKSLFYQAWDSHSTESIMHAQSHAEAEREQYRIEGLQASIERTQKEANFYHNDQRKLDISAEEVAGDTGKLWEGHRKDRIELEKDKARKGFYAGILQTKLMQDPQDALIFLDKNAEKFDAKYVNSVRPEILRQAKDIRTSARVVELSSGPGANEVQGHEKIDAMTDVTPQEKEEMHKALRTQFSIKDVAAAEAERKAEASSWNEFEAAPSEMTIARMPVSNVVKARMRKTLADMTKSYSDKQKAQVFGELWASPNLDKINLQEFRPKMSPRQYNDLQDLQDRLKKGGDIETDAYKQAMAYAKGMMADSTAFKDHKAKQAQMLAAFGSRLQGMKDEDRANFNNVKEEFDKLMLDTTMRERRTEPVIGPMLDYFFPKDPLKKYQVESGELPKNPADVQQPTAPAAAAPVPVASQPLPPRPAAVVAPAAASVLGPESIPPAAAAAGAVSARDIGGRRVFYNASGQFVGSAPLQAPASSGGVH